MILVHSLSMTLAYRRLGLKRLSGHFLIQFLMRNKNIAVWIIQIGTKLGKFNFIKNRRKTDCFIPFQIFRFFQWKQASKKAPKPYILARCQILYPMMYEASEKSVCSTFALRAPYLVFSISLYTWWTKLNGKTKLLCEKRSTDYIDMVIKRHIGII